MASERFEMHIASVHLTESCVDTESSVDSGILRLLSAAGADVDRNHFLLCFTFALKTSIYSAT